MMVVRSVLGVTFSCLQLELAAESLRAVMLSRIWCRGLCWKLFQAVEKPEVCGQPVWPCRCHQCNPDLQGVFPEGSSFGFPCRTVCSLAVMRGAELHNKTKGVSCGVSLLKARWNGA